MLTAPSLPDTVEPCSLKPRSLHSLASTPEEYTRIKLAVSCCELTLVFHRSCRPVSPAALPHLPMRPAVCVKEVLFPTALI